MLAGLPHLDADPIGEVYALLAQDRRSDRLDLGIGVYRDATGHSPIMTCVVEAEKRLLQKQTTKEYRSPSGNHEYCDLMEALVLGAEHSALQARRVITVQTPGAGGALRAGAEVIKAASPRGVIWVPSPTWDQQLLILGSAGLRLKPYPYYDRAANRLLFDEMMTALRGASAGDAVLLHGCCHNPTGEDLTNQQWGAVALLFAERGLVPFVDLVYQGFGEGIEKDASATRYLAQSLPEMVLASSSSKTFGVYRERAGILSLLHMPGGQHRANLERHISRITRSLYFMPPDAGASTVVEVLTDTALKGQWLTELEAMRTRLASLRVLLAEALQRATGSDHFRYIAGQKGMFSLLPLGAAELDELRRAHAIYLMPDGRINVAAVSATNVERIAGAMAAVTAGARAEGS